MTDLVRTIITWTLLLSAAFLILSKSKEFNEITASLVTNWSRLLIVGRGQNLVRA